MVIKKYDVHYDTVNYLFRDIIERIKLGNELQEEKGILEDEDSILKYSSAIILAPDYQREYRFTLTDERKLIESIFVGIPIPPVFLATSKYRGVTVHNVVDGQHRLRALFRFYENKYQLKDLDLIELKENKFFKGLSTDMKQEFTNKELQVIIFKDFPGKEFELEIFNRFNKGTKPLQAQDIRHAVYHSEHNTFVNDFVRNLYELDENSLSLAYNITKSRIQKKSIQEDVFIILNILENGINESYSKSPIYAENYMKKKSVEQEQEDKDYMFKFNNIKSSFATFNEFIELISTKIEYPFSKELYGVSSRHYKFQISIAMILSGLFNKIKEEEFFVLMKNDGDILDKFLGKLKGYLEGSYLENLEYSGSSTNSKYIKELIDDIEFNDVFN
ncbi:MAG TPA: DUF262 domain-containing protein [Clostridiales bacterium]|nr:DUF262 domain-containing protein [Clostridiales bacterium]